MWRQISSILFSGVEDHPVLKPFLIVGLSPYLWYYNGIGNRIYTLDLPPALFVLADLPFPKYPFYSVTPISLSGVSIPRS